MDIPKLLFGGKEPPTITVPIHWFIDDTEYFDNTIPWYIVVLADEGGKAFAKWCKLNGVVVIDVPETYIGKYNEDEGRAEAKGTTPWDVRPAHFRIEYEHSLLSDYMYGKYTWGGRHELHALVSFRIMHKTRYGKYKTFAIPYERVRLDQEEETKKEKEKGKQEAKKKQEKS